MVAVTIITASIVRRYSDVAVGVIVGWNAIHWSTDVSFINMLCRLVAYNYSAMAVWRFLDIYHDGSEIIEHRWAAVCVTHRHTTALNQCVLTRNLRLLRRTHRVRVVGGSSGRATQRNVAHDCCHRLCAVGRS